MRFTTPTTTVLRGALLLLAVLFLSACARERKPSAPTLVEVPVAVMQTIPEDRIKPLAIENQLPPGNVPNGAIEDRLLRCEAVVERANADRCWIRCRQGGLSRDECEGVCDE